MADNRQLKSLQIMLKEALRGEPFDQNIVGQALEDGKTLVLGNSKRSGKVRPTAIGKGTRTKVNANIGTSRDRDSIVLELEKLRTAVDAGADTVMDLSTGRGIHGMLEMVLEECDLPVGTVPLYGLAVQAVSERQGLKKISERDFIDAVISHCEAGVDFITVHCGVTREGIRHLEAEGRVTDIVSRGGSFIYRWMKETGGENPLYAHYDEILETAGKYNVTLSLGDGLRPGSIADATDRCQTAELLVLGELVERAHQAGVQVMVEGPGHVPIDQIKMNVQMEKEICKGAPFYVLGPLVCDVAPGYDHITAAIGGALAAAEGADFLCYVTPAEHLGLPDVNDVREGVMAARIAAHAADVAKDLPGAADWDLNMSHARKKLDWKRMFELAIDPSLARRYRGDKGSGPNRFCTMCGELCALRK